MMSACAHIVCSVVGGLLAFAVLTGAAIWRSGGVFEYPLDDVYIHLAMAEQLFAGGYGVNSGEFASAASSPLYPLLLPTWAGLAVQAWLPLVWNSLSLAVAAAALGWAVAQAGLGRAGLLLAAIAPFALAMPVVAFTGMENMAHSAASLAILLGLWVVAKSGTVTWPLILGVLLAPALRLEGLALALAAAGVVLLLGRPFAGLLLGALALLPVVVFSAALSSLGLDPLPNSVNAKLPDPAAEEAGLLMGLANTFRFNIATYGGRFLLALTLVVAVLTVLLRKQGRNRDALVIFTVVAAALAHLGLASIGWMDRYENYLVVTLFAALALASARFGATTKTVLMGGALIGGIATYAPWLDNHISNPRAIHLQHAQMARFAKEHVKAPVAVNDLGHIAWNNQNYVLDLWGLASADALAARMGRAPDGWADALSDARDVRVAMIYTHVIGEALGPDWVKLGDLILLEHGGAFLGGDAVSFYARTADQVDPLRAELQAWATGLPAGAVFVFEEREAGS